MKKSVFAICASLLIACAAAGCSPSPQTSDSTGGNTALKAAPVGAPDYSAFEAKSVMPVGGWVIPVPTKENFETAKEAGFNFFHNVNRDFSGQGVGDVDETMKLLEECGMQGFVQLQGEPYTQYERNKFMRYKSFAGFNFYDEPSAAIFDDLQEEGESFKKKYPDKLFFANLFPSYASNSQLGASSFAEYVQAYIDTVPCDVLSYDYYALKGNSASSQIDTGWLASLEVMGNAAKQKGVDFWSFLQSMSFGSHNRAPKSAADISFQVYTNLCYGVKGLEYFCYMSPAVGTEFTVADVALIDRNNQKTPIYDYVKEANEEILAFDHVFLQYDWENVMPVYGSGEKKENSAFKALKNPLMSSEYFADASATHDALIGQFRDAEEGYEGFLLVNYSDPFYPQTTELSLRFDADKALVYERGVPRTVTLENGRYTCTLASGEGRFVIPYKEA